MKPGIVIRPDARAEIDDHAEYLARRNPSAAQRFLVAVEQTLENLLVMPGMGTAWPSEKPRLKKVRRRPVHGFRNYLVFYRPAHGAIEVLHLFHGAQNIADILDQEEPDR